MRTDCCVAAAFEADEADDILIAFAEDFRNRTELAEILAADANEVECLEPCFL